MIAPDRPPSPSGSRTHPLRAPHAAPWFAVVLFCLTLFPAVARSDSFGSLSDTYDATIRPLLRQFCYGCHSNQKQEADLNLERFSSLAKVRRQPRTWQKALFMLDNREMPPKESKPLSTVQRKSLREWLVQYLSAEAKANAGDPGRVVVRRLSNVEFNNTIRDLTGVNFQPARQFPVDSVAGEGFANTGESLVMSPGLLEKYLRAAHDIASHAVLLPNGFRFSTAATQRDREDELLGQIRAIHARHTQLLEERNAPAATRMQWGHVDLGAYLRTMIAQRERLVAADEAITAIADAEQLNSTYLRHLTRLLRDEPLSPLLQRIASRLQTAQIDEADAITEEVAGWQRRLSTLEPIGQSFKNGLQPVNPIAPQYSVRTKIEAQAGQDVVTLSLVTGNAGQASEGDIVVWHNPRIESPQSPPLRLRDARTYAARMTTFRKLVFTHTADYLAAVADVSRDARPIGETANRHQVEVEVLRSWLDYLSLRPASDQVDPGQYAKLDGLLTEKVSNVAGNELVRGWKLAGQPSTLVANSSDRDLGIPGSIGAHGIQVHPSPSHFIAAGWRSPFRGVIQIETSITDGHGACGDGQTWALIHARPHDRRPLARGVIDRAGMATANVDELPVQKGDVVSLIVGPRGDYGCDGTMIELVITEQAAAPRKWDLAADVEADVHAGNPHHDRYGTPHVWSFFSQPIGAYEPTGPALPLNSSLARWRTSMLQGNGDAAARFAEQLTALFTAGPSDTTPAADRQLLGQVLAASSPLFGRFGFQQILDRKDLSSDADAVKTFGLDPQAFAGDGADLVAQAPSTIRVRLPADLFSGLDFVVDAQLSPTAENGSIQARVQMGPGVPLRSLTPGVPIVVRAGTDAHQQMLQAFDDFRALLPRVMCCRTVVPLDHVITTVQLHREDANLSRLLLAKVERQRLDRLWDELFYISREPIRVHESFQLLVEFASQVGEVPRFEPHREPIRKRAEAFAKYVEECESRYVDHLLAFAKRAFREPLSDDESRQLRDMYERLRALNQTHEEAFRGVLAGILVAPRFLYRIEEPPPGEKAGPVSDSELATRLSYFLWSTMPDDDLRKSVRMGNLSDPGHLIGQTRRMLQDHRIRGLATEFACQWLLIHNFDTHDEKNERQYPTFAELRGDMYQEAIRFFEDLFRRDGSVLEIVDADHAFLNASLARHYGIDGVRSEGWQRVDGMRKHSRGGVLGMAAVLSRQSGATRTSPVLRGNWIVEMLLGEKLPDPPATVPKLSDTVNRKGLTVRQLTEQHVRDEACAKCHIRIDPFGFALESFDAIGRFRTKDLVDQPVDTKVRLQDGTEFEGIAGLRSYLLTERRGDLLRQFSRKLLGYALGRAVALSDEPLIDAIVEDLTEQDYRVSAAIETIVRSQPFRYHRALEATKPQAE